MHTLGGRSFFRSVGRKQGTSLKKETRRKEHNKFKRGRRRRRNRHRGPIKDTAGVHAFGALFPQMKRKYLVIVTPFRLRYLSTPSCQISVLGLDPTAPADELNVETIGKKRMGL
ncbi:hypothetical protein K435DRAFT_393940 [Dendrothele bispora CBS 962.96]|uniref:Uncharacterized protein n=1 Tax=Dendrothele bispora (strain CBS 962.96) TaxID=1314807 RepID=A0A4V4HD10_DENBC|nr:hypothetical protein K435DRAFT_393940 [Dendrothele bispora CBS 962.96]